MMKKILLFLLFFTIALKAQVPFPHFTTSNNSAERVAGFGVTETPNDLLEITNSTQFDNSFIPSIWAHQQSDNRFVLRLFATTKADLDNGDIPIMIFRSELRNSINLNAPEGSTFPWGTNAANVNNRPVFAWENGNTQLMTMSANGYLGLGVIAPTALFHSNGTIRFENLGNATTPSFMLGTDADGNVFEYPVAGGGGGTAQNDADWLKPDGTVSMNIDDNIYTNGKVGINTSVFPTHVGTEDVSFYRLFVTGGILTEEVRVSLVEEWADYVFKEGYKLPTLAQVEEHIKEKGHLINIPSEQDVKQNGIELAEMNKLLLEKVEELTLYMIEMNKKMEAMQKEVEELKAAKK